METIVCQPIREVRKLLLCAWLVGCNSTDRTTHPAAKEQPASTKRNPLSLLIGAVVVVVVIAGTLLSYLFYRPKRETARGAVTPVAVPAPAASVRSIAVLPFHDLAGQDVQGAWGVGMADAIISRLTTLQNLANIELVGRIGVTELSVCPSRSACGRPVSRSALALT